MTLQNQINEMRRTITWIKKTITLLNDGRIDLAKNLLEEKIKELNAIRLDLSVRSSMTKREQRKRENGQGQDVHRDRHWRY